MKKINIITIAVILLSLAGGNAYSQNLRVRSNSKWDIVEITKPKKEKEKKPKAEFSRKEGVYLRPEVAVGLFSGKNEEGSTTIFAHGGYANLNVNYQVKPFLTAGIGVGYQTALGSYSYNYYKFNGDSYPKDITTEFDPLKAIPVYANARLYLGTGKCQPYFDFKVGYSIPLNSSTVDIYRSYITTGVTQYVPQNDGTSIYCIQDTWNQYDKNASISGLFGAVGFGFSAKDFAFGIEADFLNWVYNTKKTRHTELRPNGMPQWEYESTLASHNVTTDLMNSGNENEARTMISFKIDYNIPILIRK